MPENTILCSSSGNNAGFISKYNTKVWASDCFAIISKNITITNNYLYYLLKLKQDDIFKYQNGSAQPHIYSSDLNKHIKIKIPKNKKLIEDMETTFKEIEELHNDVKKAEELYKQFNKELSQEAIPNQPIINEVINNSNDDNDDNDDTESTESTETEIQEEEKIIKPITTKSKNISIKSSKSKKTSITLNDILSNDD